MSADSYPLVNDTAYGWSSVEITAKGRTFTGFKNIRYKDALEPGIVYGTSAFPTGRTEGQGSNEGSFEMYKRDFQALISFLAPAGSGAGYMRVSFPVAVSYEEEGVIVTDELIGVRITSAEDAPQEGSEPATVKGDLSILRIRRDGSQA